MTPKYTPGPWSVNTTTIISYDRDFKVWGPEGVGHGIICRTFNEGLIPSKSQAETAKANALLIAAAPEMYEVLIALDEFYQASGPIWDTVRWVISKAKGVNDDDA